MSVWRRAEELSYEGDHTGAKDPAGSHLYDPYSRLSLRFLRSEASLTVSHLRFHLTPSREQLSLAVSHAGFFLTYWSSASRRLLF